MTLIISNFKFKYIFLVILFTTINSISQVKPENVGKVTFGESEFIEQQIKGTWVKRNKEGKVTSKYKSSDKDEWSLYLINVLNNKRTQIDLWQKKIVFDNGSSTVKIANSYKLIDSQIGEKIYGSDLQSQQCDDWDYDKSGIYNFDFIYDINNRKASNRLLYDQNSKNLTLKNIRNESENSQNKINSKFEVLKQEDNLYVFQNLSSKLYLAIDEEKEEFKLVQNKDEAAHLDFNIPAYEENYLKYNDKYIVGKYFSEENKSKLVLTDKKPQRVAFFYWQYRDIKEAPNKYQKRVYLFNRKKLEVPNYGEFRALLSPSEFCATYPLVEDVESLGGFNLKHKYKDIPNGSISYADAKVWHLESIGNSTYSTYKIYNYKYDYGKYGYLFTETNNGKIELKCDLPINNVSCSNWKMIEVAPVLGDDRPYFYLKNECNQYLGIVGLDRNTAKNTLPFILESTNHPEDKAFQWEIINTLDKYGKGISLSDLVKERGIWKQEFEKKFAYATFDKAKKYRISKTNGSYLGTNKYDDPYYAKVIETKNTQFYDTNTTWKIEGESSSGYSITLNITTTTTKAINNELKKIKLESGRNYNRWRFRKKDPNCNGSNCNKYLDLNGVEYTIEEVEQDNSTDIVEYLMREMLKKNNLQAFITTRIEFIKRKINPYHNIRLNFEQAKFLFNQYQKPKFIFNFLTTLKSSNSDVKNYYKANIDDIVWKNAMKKGTKEGYNEYLNFWANSPDHKSFVGIHRERAFYRFAFLEKQTNIFENFANLFKGTSKRQSLKESAILYLNAYPNGKFRENAVWEYLYGSWKKAKTFNELPLWKKFIEDYDYVYNNFREERKNIYGSYNYNIGLNDTYKDYETPDIKFANYEAKNSPYLVIARLEEVKLLAGGDDHQQIQEWANTIIGTPINSFLNGDPTPLNVPQLPADLTGIELNINTSPKKTNETFPEYRLRSESVYRSAQNIKLDPVAKNIFTPDVGKNYGMATGYNDTTINYHFRICETDENDVKFEGLKKLISISSLGAAELLWAWEDATMADVLKGEREREILKVWSCDDMIGQISFKDIPTNDTKGVTREHIRVFDNYQKTTNTTDKIVIAYQVRFIKMDGAHYLKYKQTMKESCNNVIKLKGITEHQKKSTPAIMVRNETDFPLQISLNVPLLGHMYYDVVAPGEVFFRDIGALPFSFDMEAQILLDGQASITDQKVFEQIIWDVVETSANVAMSAGTGGAGGLLKNGVKTAGMFGKNVLARRGISAAFKAGLNGAANRFKLGTIKYVQKETTKEIIKATVKEQVKDGVKKLVTNIGINAAKDIASIAYDMVKEENNIANKLVTCSLDSDISLMYVVRGGVTLPCIDESDIIIHEPTKLEIFAADLIDNTKSGNQSSTYKVGRYIFHDKEELKKYQKANPYYNPNYVPQY
ncbi:MAG: hypothetical protein ACI9JT_001583 [Polaribacter sp.]|jgi:hypothetical protein